MDGLDRLIEMLEKRFGKAWADALLLIAVLGAAAWGIHSLIVYLVVPAARTIMTVIAYFQGGPIALSRAQIITFAVEIALSILSLISFRWFIKWHFSTIRRQGRELSTLLDRSQQYVEEQSALMNRNIEIDRAAAIEVADIVKEAREFSRKTYADLRALIKNAKIDAAKLNDEAKDEYAAILADAEARLKSLAPLHQSPEDTGEDKQR